MQRVSNSISFSLLFLLLVTNGQSVCLGEDVTKSPEIRCDPAKVLGAESCAKCHEHEISQWKQTPHYATFEILHRKPEAKTITKKLGLKSVKRNDTCVKCHYTRQLVDDRIRVVAGVSCESCHGGSKDWLAMHNDYGGPTVTKEAESEEHKIERIEASVAAGMNNPSNLYLMARQCLACHTTPDEKLVNVGGHNAGSREFELVSWSQGVVRHNFLRTNGTANGASTPAQLRVMYIVGVMADLEASMRATAQATTKDVFGTTAAQRAARQKLKLYEINKLVNDSQVHQAVDIALNVPLKLNHSEALIEAANKIGQTAYEFAATADGEKLSAIDDMLPKAGEYKNP